MIEEWRTIKDFPDYEVSNMGRIRSKDRYRPYAHGLRLVKGQPLKTRPNAKRNGYVYVQLCDKSKHYACKLHRLVAEAFIPNPEGKPQVNHIDCDVTNNRVDNLEWVTAKENSHWTKVCGRQAEPRARALIATNVETGEQLYYRSGKDAERHGHTRSAIWRCVKGEYKTHHGLEWSYA